MQIGRCGAGGPNMGCRRVSGGGNSVVSERVVLGDRRCVGVSDVMRPIQRVESSVDG